MADILIFLYTAILIFNEKSLTLELLGPQSNLNILCRLPSPSELRSEGLCPLTPEEAVLMLAALGFNRKTHIFVAGSNLYGGRSRLVALTSLYPKLVTKENLLSTAELEPFANYSSQVSCYCHHCFIYIEDVASPIKFLDTRNFVLCDLSVMYIAHHTIRFLALFGPG